MRNNLFSHVRVGVFFLPLILSSCAVWHKIESPPPQYAVYPTLSLTARLTETNWYDSNPSFGPSIKEWKNHYDQALEEASSWSPGSDLLQKTFTNVCYEFGERETNADTTGLVQKALAFFYTNNNSAYAPFWSDGTHSNLDSEIRVMFGLTDEEQANLFVTNWQQLKRPPRSSESTFLSTRLPTFGSPVLPVGVSVTPIWESPDETPSKPAVTNEEKVVLDKLLLTVEAASSTNTNESKGTEKSDSAISDFQPEQKVTVNISTVLNSPSVLDRIEYVSTYIYIYPWQNAPNGDVVLEREFWRNFFNINIVRDSLIKSNMAGNDMRRAIADMRVRVRDIGTTVQYDPIDLGTLQQTTSDTTDLGLSNAASPALPISSALRYTGLLNSIANITLKQQLDQRSTYIAPHGDFVRITQRGMQSVNLAGRIKEIVTLNVPAAVEKYRVLEPIQKSAQDGMSNAVVRTLSNGNQDTNEFEVTTVSQPLYSRVEGVTFSVVVARQATHLLHSSRDRYGLDDARDAAFIADVTPPQLITFWQWERDIDTIQTWDILGKTDAPSKLVYFRTFDDERPTPLYLLNFTPQERAQLIAEIQAKLKDGIVKLQGLSIGLLADENSPTNLLSLKDSR